MSNNPRIYIWGALLIVLWLNYQAWMKDYGPHPGQTVAGAPASQAPPPPDLANRVPHAGASSPTAGSASAASASPLAPGATTPGGAAAAPADTAERIRVVTDVLEVDISTRGGTITRAALLKYPLVKGQPEPVTLEDDASALTRYLLQSGLTGPEAGSYPDHLALFSSPRSQYELGDAQELRVPLTWTNGKGLTSTKTFVFRRGEYAIQLEQELSNKSAQPVQVAAYTQIVRNDPRTKSSMFNIESRTRHGPAYYDGHTFRLLDMSPDSADAHLSKEVKGGWIAAVQHHFLTAVVPPTDQPMHVSMEVQGDLFVLTTTGQTQVVPQGASARFPKSLFIGPQLQSELDTVGPNLSLVTDYGWLKILAGPLFSLLSGVHKLTGNWGVAIILVTLLLKLVFYPLQEASGRSMAKMKNLGPRIKALQDTYKDDREKLGQAMMELYRREKINPVAGCLPILIQIPVFIAFYWVLLGSVEMRQAPFLGFWIRDLSSRDPWFILPAIMAGAMFLQYRMNPPSPDPVQAKVFMVMPFVMSVTFAFFPAGLVLYWVTNTLLSIAQQWNINRRLVASGHKN
jgi:YidC/Oxa1 family membrane protein insertase